MLIGNKYRNYRTRDFIAVKLATFSWHDSVLALKKKAIEFINSFGEYKDSMAALSVHVLHNAILKKKLHEMKLDLKMIRKLRAVIMAIVHHVDPINYRM
ncbi:hypothetical protein [Xenorhabdus stockiae]|uniref:hypothetical protein n=1 Tax=Xenorhabdus stockiae TaxID=351614 RepID=UPI00406429AA